MHLRHNIQKWFADQTPRAGGLGISRRHDKGENFFSSAYLPSRGVGNGYSLFIDARIGVLSLQMVLMLECDLLYPSSTVPSSAEIATFAVEGVELDAERVFLVS